MRWPECEGHDPNRLSIPDALVTSHLQIGWRFMKPSQTWPFTRYSSLSTRLMSALVIRHFPQIASSRASTSGKAGRVMLSGRVHCGGYQYLFRKLEGEVGQQHGHSGLVIDLGQVLANAVPGSDAKGDEALHLAYC